VNGRSAPEAGFTFIELTAAILILSVGLLSLAGVIISVKHQREQSTARGTVLHAAETVIEEMKGSPNPEALRRTYDGRTYGLAGIQGAFPDGSVLRVQVDAADPKLVQVTLGGAWIVLGHVETLDLFTQVYSEKVQE
jgi:Tfp pilus assembly protein PilV